LTVTIGATNGADRWHADADPSLSLDAVRHPLSKVSDALAQAVHAEREER
jgi:hypothetical protein